MTAFIEDADIIAGHRDGGRAVFHRQPAKTHRIGGDRPTGLGLPPVIDDRDAELGFRPLHRIGIGALAGEKERAEFGKIVFADKIAVGIFLLDGAESGRRGEQGSDLVLRDHAPVSAGIRRTDRLSLIEDGSRTME